MKSLLLYTLLIAFAITVEAQNNVNQYITGKVFRFGTDSVIVSASVYYSSSTVGTITDANGNFELVAKQQQVPIIVSCIGYYSSTVNYQQGKPLYVYLKTKNRRIARHNHPR